ncbi:transglutaminase-like domain-containing protein [Clostridium sp. Marseille-P3244]|uniref:transglutaminase-like domain-containing protein n=1 Tax=Clostridium sp. Marseille-P3244 TaxID=1871020 RepID=UPI00092FEA99|nr:transglutaminase-like domain-containing protein [Clostridium sp. Marseille-P3244]
MDQTGHKMTGKSTVRDKRSALELAVLFAGICGLLLVIRPIPHVFFREGVVFPVILAVCFSMYILFGIRRKWLFIEIAVLFMACGVLAGVQRDRITVQISALMAGLTEAGVQNEENITLLIVLAGTVISVCFFILDMVWKCHWLPYLTITVIMAGAPVFGLHIGAAPTLLGLVFQILFWVMHMADRPVFRRSFVENRRGEKSRHPEESRKWSLPVRCSVLMGGVLAVLVCVSIVITALWGSGLSELVYSGEGVVSRSVQRMTGRARQSVSDGHVSGGNNYRTGESQLQLTLLQQPEDTLYLKGFTGGEYTGGDWEPVDEAPLFHEMALSMNWETWEYWISGLYYNLYYSMNMASAGEDVEPGTMFVRHLDESYGTLYMPYYSSWIDRTSAQSVRPGYGFNFYDESEMNINWDNVPEDFRTVRDWYQQIQTAYMQVITDAYTVVPEELLPRLTELCRDRYGDPVDEVTAFIIAALRENASYTLTPGRAPLNEDVVEYYLFDNHEGFCVHFASAATLMYRLCGIPARYVSGYAVPPSDFVQREDGMWTAEVTDEYAHAWTEIFLEDYGWVPVEVTPASDGSYDVSYPGLDSEALATSLSEISLDIELPGNSGEAAVTQTEQRGQGTGGAWDFFPEIDLDRYHELIIVIITVVVETLILLPLFLDYRKLRIRRKTEQMKCREIFAVFIRMLHTAGYLSGYDGTEVDFPEKLSEELPCVERQEAVRLTETVRRAAYGPEGSSEAEDEFVRGICFRVEAWIRSRKKRRT